MKKVKLLLVCLLIENFSACVEVQPWQKGNLAKQHMSFEPDTLEARQRQHIYFSKEASSGGYGVGGGGCGCN